MLKKISIACPKCGQTTPLAVATPSLTEVSASSTACRQCRSPFFIMTEPSGRMTILDGNEDLESAAPVVLGILEPPGRSGYRVRPPAYLGVLERGFPRKTASLEHRGLTDEQLATNVVSIKDLFVRPDGSVRSPKEAAKFVGWRTVWVAQLQNAVEERLAGPPPLSFPPGVFISYRWGSDEENAWAADLASQLRSRGYAVIFDRDESGPVDVPKLVSRIADCRYFLSLLDRGYAERIGTGAEGERTKDGWVYNEVQIARSFSNSRQLRILGMIRGDHALPEGFRHPNSPGSQGNTVDVRSKQQLQAFLDDVFPAIENAPDEATVQRARELLRASHESLCQGEVDAAFESARALSMLLPGVIDGRVQTLRVAIHAGWHERCVESATEAIALAPESRELRFVAGSAAYNVGDYLLAIEHLSLQLELPGADDDLRIGQAQLVLGSALDELNQVHAGIAHLERALSRSGRDASGLMTLGFVYRRAGETRRALDCFQEGLELDPGNTQLLENLTAAFIEAGSLPDARAGWDRLAEVAPGHPKLAGLQNLLLKAEGLAPVLLQLVKVVEVSENSLLMACDACNARVPVSKDGGLLCSRCGASVTGPLGPCPLCRSTGRIAPIALVGAAMQCPYCREGSISPDEAMPGS